MHLAKAVTTIKKRIPEILYVNPPATARYCGLAELRRKLSNGIGSLHAIDKSQLYLYVVVDFFQPLHIVFRYTLD